VKKAAQQHQTDYAKTHGISQNVSIMQQQLTTKLDVNECLDQQNLVFTFQMVEFK